MNRMIRTLHAVRRFVRRFREDAVGAYAAQSAYFILLSFIPFVMLLAALVKYTPLTEEILSQFLVRIVPFKFQSLVLAIISEIFDRSAAVLPLSLVTALWSAGKGINALTNGLNSVYRVSETRNYVVNRLRSMFYTLIFVVAILATILFLIFGNAIQRGLAVGFPILTRIATFLVSMRTLVTLGLLTLVFMLAYKVLPNRKSNWYRQFPGAAVSAVSWSAFSLGFSFYLDWFSGAASMYGSLATVIFLMLWLYFCMWIILIGAEINSSIEEYLLRLEEAAMVQLRRLQRIRRYGRDPEEEQEKEQKNE